MEFLKIDFVKRLSLNFLILNIAFLLLSNGLLSQQNDSINYFQEGNRILKENIKTVLLHRDGWDLSPALLKFDTDEKLKLSFDDLEADGKEYMYTIVHCDASWQPSALEQYEYIDGYYEDYIYEFQYSLNTIVSYTHYELLFPTVDLKPKLSGNYILKVFVENIDSLYFTRRFMIVDQKVNIEGRVKQATDYADKKYKQEVDFEMNSSIQIINPYRDLNITIIQNGRWDNAIRNLKPKMVVGQTFDFNYDYENVFDGGNEFRNFDIKSLNYYTEYLAKIDYTHDGYQVTLKDGEKRSFKNYRSEDDINGQLKIKTEDQDLTEIRSEYVNVHFSLPYAAPLIDGDIFIIGAITDWNFSDEAKMEYDYKKMAYTKTMLLKQGYYNYQYILKNHNEGTGDVGFIEGNHWETRNEYTILVYYRNIGDKFDSLIGVTHLFAFEE
jgi:hypothetical protein